MTERDHRSGRAAARDRGLRRAARAKGWLAVLAVGLTVALSAVAAEALPGASRRPVAAAVRPAATLSSASGPMAPDPTADDPAASDPAASAPAASAPLQPPPEPPAAAPSDQSSGAVSGGS